MAGIFAIFRAVLRTNSWAAQWAKAGRSLGLRFAAERERWILWTPAVLGVGIGLYFALLDEPAVWIGPAGCALAVSCAILVKRWPGFLLAAIAVMIVAIGFTLAQWSTLGAGHVTLDRVIASTTVAGRVASVEQLADGTRVLLDKVRISVLEPPATPEHVRLRLRNKMPDLLPGDWIQVRARLAPPPPPAMPGSYDFQFLYYFQEIGGTGFALGRARLLSDTGDHLSLANSWERFRERLTTRIRDSIGGTAGAVAAALITGDRGAIPEEINDAYRNSGIYHLLSISGMHIGLVAGLLFALVRATLALVPTIALRYPIKKWAAAIAIAGALFYTLLAGATVPTQRSFFSMGLVLAAIILDRQGISMRFVAIAATIILIFQPEALLNASFQMSFAAVVALIAAYEVWGSAFAQGRDKGWLRRGLLYVGAVALTTVIATLATAPFSIYHFNRVALYGLLGNLIAVPLSSVLVMPAAVIGMVLMPFGLEDYGLVPMGWGIDLINASAQKIASADWAVTTIAAMPATALVAMVVGGLWICLWRGAWRGVGLAGIAAGIALAATAGRPDIIVDGNARLFAVAGADGRMLVSSKTTARFERDIWLRRAGYDAGEEEAWTKAASGDPISDGPRCDETGCIWQVRGETVAFVTERAALLDDCRTATIVVSAVPVSARRCPSARILIDRFDLWRNGTHALWIGANGVKIESVNGVRGKRPWVVRPGTARTPQLQPNQTPEEEEIDLDSATPIGETDTNIP